jgi:NTP pyrophosphatase (non-canonical NTP hydrolase)
MIKEETIEKIRKFVSDRNWKQFHTNCNLAKSIVLEASEILELFQWQEDAKNIDDLKDEIADVLTYVIMLCDNNGFDMDEIINNKLKKNIEKYPVDKSFGSSKKYNELKG